MNVDFPYSSEQKTPIYIIFAQENHETKFHGRSFYCQYICSQTTHRCEQEMINFSTADIFVAILLFVFCAFICHLQTLHSSHECYHMFAFLCHSHDSSTNKLSISFTYVALQIAITQREVRRKYINKPCVFSFGKHQNINLKIPMGQTIGTTSPESVLEDTVDTIHYEFKKHTQSLMEIGSLTYEEFNVCLSSLNDLYES